MCACKGVNTGSNRVCLIYHPHDPPGNLMEIVVGLSAALDSCLLRLAAFFHSHLVSCEPLTSSSVILYTATGKIFKFFILYLVVEQSRFLNVEIKLYFL